MRHVPDIAAFIGLALLAAGLAAFDVRVAAIVVGGLLIAFGMLTARRL